LPGGGAQDKVALSDSIEVDRWEAAKVLLDGSDHQIVDRNFALSGHCLELVSEWRG
jgi:hypothetical protein